MLSILSFRTRATQRVGFFSVFSVDLQFGAALAIIITVPTEDAFAHIF
jgi:hypothetical protein